MSPLLSSEIEEGLRSQMVPCPNCGFQNAADDSFCGNCRRALEPQPAEPAATPAASASEPTVSPIEPAAGQPASAPEAPSAAPLPEPVPAAAPEPALPPAAAPESAPAAAAAATDTTDTTVESIPKPASQKRVGKVPCPNCGFANEADDRFCGNCRTPLGEAAAAAAAAPQRIAPPAAPGPAKPATPGKPGQVICPSCGTANAAERLFCVKCATQLRADALPPKKPPFRVHRGMVLPFVLSMVIGLGATVGGARIGAIVLARAPQPTDNPEATHVVLPGGNGDPAAFDLKPADPKPAEPLPPDKGIVDDKYVQPTETQANDPDHVEPWWNDSIPRVPVVTQFDGGPLQKVNCVMAAGAMLARLAYGIVTTGSQLRTLQTDQEGASSYTDLDDAVGKGWNVGFIRGRLTPLQLRALSYAGAGIVVSLNYGEIPRNEQIQKGFDGNHSVYVDGFTPVGPNGVPAYYVMDPIGRAERGYKGGWWNAEDVERAGIARTGNGKIYATWGFAGGIVPSNYKRLPPNAVPGAPTVGPIEPTAEPTEVPASEAPIPTGDVDVPADDPDTGTPPPEVPPFIPIDIITNVYVIEPKPEGLACTVQPIPTGCPGGIIGHLGEGGPNDPTAPPVDTIDILYGTIVAPNTVQIVFDRPSGTNGQLWTWSGTGIPIMQTSAQSALIGGQSVSVATITVDGTVSFFATATSNSFSGFSTVGTLVVGS